MKKVVKIAHKLTQTILTIVTRVENNQREKVLYKVFLPVIVYKYGKYGYPGLAFKSEQNQSFFKTQVWFAPWQNQGSGIWLTANKLKRKTLKRGTDLLLKGKHPYEK
jgi:hypothetical protein